MERRNDLGAGGVFISYRREDSAYAAGWLYDRLRDRLGGEEIFKDDDNIRAGDDFVAAITAAVGSCQVVLVLIGKEWATVRDGTGARRLNDPDDFVRLEIEAALARDIRIIPVLVAGARMPDPAGLPPSIAPITRRQALELSPGRFDTDAQGVVAAVANTLAEVRGIVAQVDNERATTRSRDRRVQSTAARSIRVKRRAGIAGAVVVLVTAGLAAIVWRSGSSGRDVTTSWRLFITPLQTESVHCTVTATNSKSGQSRRFEGINGRAASYQMLGKGDWRWSADDPRCQLDEQSGAGRIRLPLLRAFGYGDTDAFAASTSVVVTVEDAGGQGKCPVELRAVDDGRLLDQDLPDPAGGSVELDSKGSTPVYLSGGSCALRIANAR